MFRFLISLALVLVLPSITSAKSISDQERSEIEQIVKEYIAENPELIHEALLKIARQMEAQEQVEAKQSLADSKDALFNDTRDYSIGPVNADLTIVEFFDYRCGYCKASRSWVLNLPEEHKGRIRIVFKEFPILSAESEQAALAALAAGKQGKYNEMHVALMESRSSFNRTDIVRIAKKVGVDVKKMEREMKTIALRQHLSDNRALANRIGSRSTPTYVIGDEIVQGFNRPHLDALIENLLG